MKKKPVKEEPEASVKLQPFWPLLTEAQQRCVAQGGVRRRQRLSSNGPASDDLCEGWNRNLLNASQTELSLNEQEGLSSDYTSLTFEQDLLHHRLKVIKLGDMVTSVTLPIQEGMLEESLPLSLAKRQVAQSHEQLVQEVCAF